ncbi:hypothetical protein GCM10009846_30420 [Agrococcus versicolor]|uniref:Transposase IS204/IS1001/IS1096/IS1165 zinc-finger domain-containing protein n=1 Tax=Agrococcus versicolor TaxID=501482 RepID=A0ABP5MQD0_9MICO
MTATIAIVTGAGSPSHRVRVRFTGPPYESLRCSRCAAMEETLPSRTHSGHCTPTGAWIWHWPQMVRPHRWHSVQLARPGCR